MSGPVVNMQSVMNLSYKSSAMLSHPRPADFEAMKARSKLGKPLYLSKSALRESIQRLLVPSKDYIEQKKNCDCGPTKQSIAEKLARKGEQEFVKRVRLGSMPQAKKIALLNFYNEQMDKVKFTRASVVKIKSNAAREDQLNLTILDTHNEQYEQIKERTRKEELSHSVPQLKRSNSKYLSQRFELMAFKGLDKVCHTNLHGSKQEIE